MQAARTRLRRGPAPTRGIIPADTGWTGGPAESTAGTETFYSYSPETVPVPTKPRPPDPSQISQLMRREDWFQQTAWKLRRTARMLLYPSWFAATYPTSGSARMQAKPRYDFSLPYPPNTYAPPVEKLRAGRMKARGRFMR